MFYVFLYTFQHTEIQEFRTVSVSSGGQNQNEYERDITRNGQTGELEAKQHLQSNAGSAPSANPDLLGLVIM
ncbi:hypothetical protein T265_07196 [Opisthorchis viverrini]|uniref:Uncharacterized protein n=1 Tax=Opisthorchis viverrini TaxID=6198 RepID=A0A075AC84_OPIVI|nr:hypothetical protein T265_07196 [Opisthorchis viverrini]KER25319.1 hypothetical protein T265_07196 [Opisthorchis viverrini]